MLKRIKDLILYANKTGLPLPMAQDGGTKKPSVTLLIFYTGLILSIMSIVMLHGDPDKYLSATLVTLLFLGMGFIFYRIRNLDKVKLDLTNKSIELEDTHEPGEGTGSSGDSAEDSSKSN